MKTMGEHGMDDCKHEKKFISTMVASMVRDFGRMRRTSRLNVVLYQQCPLLPAYGVAVLNLLSSRYQSNAFDSALPHDVAISTSKLLPLIELRTVARGKSNTQYTQRTPNT